MPSRPSLFRRGPGSWYRSLKSLEFLVTRDRTAVRAFLRSAAIPPTVTTGERIAVVRAFVRITNGVRGYHTLGEMLRVAERILQRTGAPELAVVEAGAGKGASTAKLSLATARAGGRLHVFDSFRGIPPNDERHVSIDGRDVVFRAGAFSATLPSVRRVVERHGAPAVCTFHKGWFEDTLPEFAAEVDVALLDVDLLASTRTCVRWLWPKVKPGGSLFTQDGHLGAVVELLGDPQFWEREVGTPPPEIPGLGRDKLLEIVRR